jgi:valyl-tRNA synthetase
MDVRPQGHDIIRTWLFATMVRSHHEHGTPPWRNAALSGWILDPDRKKMSKSKGNVVTPMHLLEQYGTDAVRYWAASGRPGVDTAFDESQMKIGRKLATKLLNVTKFVLTFGELDAGAAPTEAVDLAMLARLGAVADDATAAFDGYDYARALERTEAFFWWFCDDYVELVKSRAYGDDPTSAQSGSQSGSTQSARAALRVALSSLQRLLAPFLPFVTDEVWSWWQTGSVHATTWPTSAELAAGTGDGGVDPAWLDPLGEVLAAVRRAKTEAKVSQRAEIERLVVHGSTDVHEAVQRAVADLREAGSIRVIEYVVADDLHCTVDLVP